MKTSVMEVHDMLSVLSVDGVEKRIGEVPGVESVTVNYAAGNATVRYDETRLDIPDIKSAVRQSGYESFAPDATPAGEGHAGAGVTPKTSAPSTPKTPPEASAAGGTPKQDQAVPDEAPTTTSKPSPSAPDAVPAPTSAAAQKSASGAPAAAPADHEQHNKNKS